MLLREWEYEPKLRCRAALDAGWGDNLVSLVATPQNQVIGCAIEAGDVSLWAVEVSNDMSHTDWLP